MIWKSTILFVVIMALVAISQDRQGDDWLDPARLTYAIFFAGLTSILIAFAHERHMRRIDRARGGNWGDKS